MAKILVLEDEKDMADAIKDSLVRLNHTVDVFYDGADGIRVLEFSKFDLIVLDLMLPHVDGFEICRRYRTHGGDAHILMLTAKSALDDKERGFMIGADDYLCKPFALREFIARVTTLLRRPQVRLPEVIEIKSWHVDLRTAVATNSDATIQLSPKEFDLLLFLYRYPSVSFSAEALLERVWSSTSTSSAEAVRTVVKTLRQKLGNSIVQHIPGFGYSFNATKS